MESLCFVNIQTCSIQFEDKALTHVELVQQTYKSFFKLSSTRAEKDTVPTAINRRRLIVVDWEFRFLDETGSRMPLIDMNDGRKLTIYSSSGPQPTEIELIAEIEADILSDIQFVHWSLFESDWEGTQYTFLDTGTFKNGPKVHIPLIPNEAGNLPISFNVRVYIDVEGWLASTREDSL